MTNEQVFQNALAEWRSKGKKADMSIAEYDRQRNELIAERNRKEQEELWMTIWAKECPLAYRQPWDWSKAKETTPRASVERVLRWNGGERGMYIIGETGAGKSRAVGNALTPLALSGKSVKRMDGVTLAAEAAENFGDCSRTAGWLHKLAKVSILWLDDLGKRWSPTTEQAAFKIIEDRTAAGKPVIITTNFYYDDMIKMSHEAQTIEPMMRRIKDFCDIIKF